MVALSQCLHGGISEHSSYSLSKELSTRGVISGGDMTTECCISKLAYLFGRYHDPVIVATLLGESMRGELTVEEDVDVQRYIPFRT